MLAKLIVLVTFMFGAMVALFWITVELVGAVADGSDWVWYLALALTAVPVLLFVIAAIRSRTRATLVLTLTAGVLLGGVLLTYPNDSVACTPVAGQSAGTDAAAEGLGNGALLEDEDVAADGSGAENSCE